MNKPLIIAVAGKKMSGKSSLCNYLSRFYALHVNMPNMEIVLLQNEDGVIAARYRKDGFLLPVFLDDKALSHNKKQATIYSFADPLKQMVCQGVLGLTHKQTCGTEEEKNSLTSYLWDTLPLEIRQECSDEYHDVVVGFSQKEIDENGEIPNVESVESIKKPRAGNMSAREIMQVVGTNIFRRYFSEKVWVDATFRLIESQKPAVALIADCRFKSEVDAVVNSGGYVVRLTRNVYPDDIHQSEVDLDDYPFEKLGDRCLIIDNHDKAIAYKNEVALNWFLKLLEERKSDVGNTTLDQVPA